MPKASGTMEFGLLGVASVAIMGATMEWLLIMILAGVVAAIMGATMDAHHGRGRGVMG